MGLLGLELILLVIWVREVLFLWWCCVVRSFVLFFDFVFLVAYKPSFTRDRNKSVKIGSEEGGEGQERVGEFEREEEREEDSLLLEGRGEEAGVGGEELAFSRIERKAFQWLIDTIVSLRRSYLERIHFAIS